MPIPIFFTHFVVLFTFITGTEVRFSFSQIQVVEYLLENEELHQNMTTIARRLGITNSHFTKIVNKLVQKEMLEKYNIEGNKKNIIICVTDTGRSIYAEYADYIYNKMFSPMFQLGNQIPKKYLPIFQKMLAVMAEGAVVETKKQPPVLIPVKK